MVVVGKSPEALLAVGAAPWPQPVVVQVVDSVRQPQSLDERDEADASRDKEDRRTIFKFLEHLTQPAKEDVDSVCAAVLALTKEADQEYGQFVNDQQDRTVVAGANRDQFVASTLPSPLG